MKSPFLLPWLAVLNLCACATPSTRGCDKPLAPMVTDTLFFGTDSPQGVIDEAAWTDFLLDDVTPRFPKGFTWIAANGQWQADQGQIVREASYVLTVVHDGASANEAAIGQLMTAYKARFRQESVLRTRSTACTQF